MSLPPFQRLLDDHGPEVHRFLVAAVGVDDADDCWQETFLAALRNFTSLAPDSNTGAWLITIARHKAIDAHRARGRRPEPHAEVPEPATTTDIAVEDDEVWEAVRELPPKQRAAVVQRYLLDLPHAEIGRLIGCSEEAARRNVHEGLKNLRRRSMHEVTSR